MTWRSDPLCGYYGMWMEIESDVETDGLMLSGVTNTLPDDLLVPQMNSVEEAQGQVHFPAGRMQFAWRIYYLHELINEFLFITLVPTSEMGSPFAPTGASYSSAPLQKESSRLPRICRTLSAALLPGE